MKTTLCRLPLHASYSFKHVVCDGRVHGKCPLLTKSRPLPMSVRKVSDRMSTRFSPRRTGAWFLKHKASPLQHKRHSKNSAARIGTRFIVLSDEKAFDLRRRRI